MDIVRTLVLVAGMAIATAVLLRVARVPVGWDPIVAIARAIAQLAALALILTWVFSDLAWTFVWLAIMAVVAIITSTRRIGWSWHVLGAVSVAIVSALAVTVALVFGTGTIELGPQYLLAVGGILTGNMMNVASLSAKRLREQYVEHRDEIEGWLALGATPRRATRRFRGASAAFSLIPTLDSTKTTGLVTLPGAFVGSIFAGADPVQAGLFQLVVLAGIAFGGAIVAVITTEALGAPKTLPLAAGRAPKAERRAAAAAAAPSAAPDEAAASAPGGRR